MALLGYGRNHNLLGRKDQLRTSWSNLGEEKKKEIFAPPLLLFVGRAFALEFETCGAVASRRTAAALLICTVQCPDNVLAASASSFKRSQRVLHNLDPDLIDRSADHDLIRLPCIFHSRFLEFARRHLRHHLTAGSSSSCQ